MRYLFLIGVLLAVLGGSERASAQANLGGACSIATTSLLGCIKPDGSTTTVNASGVLTAIGGSATSIVPGTTTIGGATAPCLIENSTGTTMACPAVTSGVITAMANAVNATGGLLTYALIGTSGATIPLLNGNNTLSGTLTLSGLGAGTQVSCLGLTSGNAVVAANGACGSGGSSAFSALTSGTNTAAAMLVGTGASLGVTGSGAITATAAPVGGLTGAGTGVVTALGNAINTSGGLATSAVTSLASLATIGTIGTGVWQGTVVAGQYGGTGVANTGKTITLGASVTTTGAGAPTLAFPSSSFTYTYPGASANLSYLVGAATAGDCVQFSGTAGGIADAGATCGGAGSLTVTDGTHSVASTTSLTMSGAQFAVSGSAGSATVIPIVTDTTHAGSFSSWNSGGQDDMTATGTATLPTFALGGTALLTAQSGVTATIGLNSQTVNGLALNTTLHQFGFYLYTYSSAGVVSALGYPGLGTVTTNALSKFIDGTGAETASSVTDAGSGVTVGSPTGGAQGAGTINATNLFVNGVAVGTGGVSSVSNSDGTLTVSPTTGAVVASLALGHANTWSGVQSFNDGDLSLNGSSSGASVLHAPATGGGALTLPVPAGNATLSQTVASGTLALGTSAISSATCATVATATATGTLTTDVVMASFNGDPTAVTGYLPATTGMLTIIIYPTANTFNAKVCNTTSASITPGPITLNWRVSR